MVDAFARHDPLPSEPARFDSVTVALAPPARRYSLRTRAPESLPETILTAAPYESGTAIKLGPDEWLLLLPADAPAPSISGIHALVDVSERSCALDISGPDAATLLQTGCPLDLAEAAFPVGKATRTLFETVEIMLWRTAADRFRAEMWKSFSPWLWNALLLNASDLA
jgi:sarcosine oxidase subunit gamma